MAEQREEFWRSVVESTREHADKPLDPVDGVRFALLLDDPHEQRAILEKLKRENGGRPLTLPKSVRDALARARTQG